MKLGKRLFAPLLVIGLLAAMVPAAVAGGSTEGAANLPLRLTRLTVLDHDAMIAPDGATASGVVTVYGLTAGSDQHGQEADLSHLCCEKIPDLSGEILLGLPDDCDDEALLGRSRQRAHGCGAQRNERHPCREKHDLSRRVHFGRESYVKRMALGTYDIVVALGPKFLEDQLTGSGGMTMATIRIRFDK